MFSPRVLWNSLVPWRRRRRYYFRAVLYHLGKLDLTPDETRATFNTTPEAFADWQAGRAVPPLFVQSLAILAYNVPPPKHYAMWRPLILTLLAIALAVEAYWWNVLR